MSNRHRTRAAAVVLAAACSSGRAPTGRRNGRRGSHAVASSPAGRRASRARRRLPTRSDSAAEPEPEPEPSDSAETSETASQTPPETPSEAPDAQRDGRGVSHDAPEDADEGTAEDADGVPAGVWWLLAALVAGLAIGVPLVLRSRRRKTWQSDFATAKDEAAWLTRELLPELRRSVSREQVAGGWAVSSARVRALEDRLTALEATSPDDPGGAQARALRDAVRAARVRVEALVAPGSALSTSSELAGVSNDLELALQQAGPESHRS